MRNLKKEMAAFFDINKGSMSNPLLLWEAYKSCVRGVLMKHGPRITESAKSEYTLLLNKIHTLEIHHKRHRQQSDEQDLLKIR